MPRHTPLYEWTAQVATRFPDRPVARARSLAEWSYGMAIAHAAQGIAVVQLATLPGRVRRGRTGCSRGGGRR